MRRLLSLCGVLMVCGASVARADMQLQVMTPSGEPLSNAVVFLKSDALRQQAEAATPQIVEMSQIEQAFVPGVMVITRGSAVEFPNRDEVRHHVYSFSPAKTFELKLYVGKPKAPVVFDQTGIVELGCNIHDTMIAWILVGASSVYGRTDEKGLVRFSETAEGSYSVDIWHRSFAYGEPFFEQELSSQLQNQVQLINVVSRGVMAP